MNEAQKHNEIVKQKAIVKGLELKHSRGKVTLQELDRAKAILATLQGITPTITTSQAIESSIQKPTQLADQVRMELDELERIKSELCNQLVELPEQECGLEIQNKILAVREKFSTKMEELRFVIQHGVRPEDELKTDITAYVKTLPADKYEAGRKLNNLRTQLCKYKDRQKKCKSDVKRQEYSALIAQTELKIDAATKYLNEL